MILALVLGYTLSAEPPSRALASSDPGDGAGTPAPRRKTHENERTAKLPDPPPPQPPPQTPAPDDEVIRNLDFLEKLPLLENLDFFDASGDSDAKSSTNR